MVIGQFGNAFNTLSRAQKTIDNLQITLTKNAEAYKKDADAALDAAKNATKLAEGKLLEAQMRNTTAAATAEEVTASQALDVALEQQAIAEAKAVAAGDALIVTEEGATVATGGLAGAVGLLKSALEFLTGPAGILIAIFGTVGMAA